jgi:periplasmic protein CpxP/Spy
MSRFWLLTLLSILLSFATTTSPARAERSSLAVAAPLPQQKPLHWRLAQNNRSANAEFKIPAGGVGNLVKELNLSPDQIQRLQKLRTNAQGKTKERRQALRTARQELTQLLQGNASSDQIRQKRQQVQTLQREIADTNFENTLAIREILTPEQRVKLQEIVQQRRQNRENLK